MKTNLQEIKIIGKGPSLKKIVKRKSNEYIVALSDAIQYCEEADYLLINDFFILERLSESELKKANALIIPTYPHVRLEDKITGKPKYHASLEDDWRVFVKKLPKGYRPRIYLLQLHTAPQETQYLPEIGESISSGEVAFAWFLHRGYRNFTSIGIDLSHGYSPLVKAPPAIERSNNWQSLQYRKILKRLKEHRASWKCSNSWYDKFKFYLTNAVPNLLFKSTHFLCFCSTDAFMIIAH